MNSQTNSKGLFALLGLIALTLIIPLTFFLAKNNQDLRKKAAGDIVGLTITPNAVTKNVGETFVSHVWLNTGTKKIGFAKITLRFDKTVLNLASDIQTTNTMSTVIKKTSIADANSTGIIEMTVGVAGGNFTSAPQGAIDFATLTFKGIKNGSSALSFETEKCQVVQIDDQVMSYDSASITNALYTIGSTDGKLIVTSPNLAYPVNQNFSAKVMLNSNEYKIGFAQVDIVFDKNILNLTGEITTNSVLSTIINKSTPSEANSNGRIKFTIGLPGGQATSAPSGLIELAQIPLKGIVAGNGKLTPNNSGIQIVSTTEKVLTLTTETTEFAIGTPQITPTVGVTLTPAVTVTPVPTLPPGATGLNLKLKINGINSTRVAATMSDLQSFKVTLHDPTSGAKATFSTTAFNVDANGVFEISPNITDHLVQMGVAPTQIFIKWSKSLQKKYAISLSKGVYNNINLSTRARDYLDACDVPDPNNKYEQDGMCNSVDYTLVSDRLSKTDTDSLKVADLNLDGVVNGVDLNILVNSINTKYEDEVL